MRIICIINDRFASRLVLYQWVCITYGVLLPWKGRNLKWRKTYTRSGTKQPHEACGYSLCLTQEQTEVRQDQTDFPGVAKAIRCTRKTWPQRGLTAWPVYFPCNHGFFCLMLALVLTLVLPNVRGSVFIEFEGVKSSLKSSPILHLKKKKTRGCGNG